MNDSLDYLEGLEPEDVIELNSDGSVKTYMIKLSGADYSFRCEECDSNCFHKEIGRLDRYICNSCDMAYISK